MEGKRYSNSFTSSGMVKEEGRAAYYKLLESVRDGDTIRIKRGVYATAEQLAENEIVREKYLGKDFVLRKKDL